MCDSHTRYYVSLFHAYILGGDIFVHAKSSNYSNLWELAQLIVGSLPPGSVAKAEDVYGWQYKEGRDLSGFIDGESGHMIIT